MTLARTLIHVQIIYNKTLYCVAVTTKPQYFFGGHFLVDASQVVPVKATIAADDFFGAFLIYDG